MICLSNLIIIGFLLSPSSLTIKRAIEELPNQNQTPRMITMSIYEDAKTQMAFNWNTTWETETIIQVSEVKDTNFETDIIEKEGTVEKSKVVNDGYIHRVVVDGLKENTTYYYRLGDKKANNWSDIGSFTTAADTHGLKFVHLSDPQGYEETHYIDYNETLKIINDKVKPDFYCLTGDIVNNSYEDANPILEQWEWALTDQKEFMQNAPFMTTAGNHEEANYDYISRFNHPSPEGGIQDDGSYYSFNYQGSHFISLNTNDTIKTSGTERGLSQEQITWLENDLKNNSNADFLIVMMHKGIYDAGGHCSNIDGEDNDISLIRNQLSPMFTKYKVDLVLQGHDHLYSRSFPLQGSLNNNELTTSYIENTKIEETYNEITYSLYQNPKGTIYLNSGTASGSKYYQVVNYDENIIPLEKTDSPTHRMFTEIIIENDTLYANVYKISNENTILFDTFGIKKDANNTSNNNQTNNNTIENPNNNSNNEIPIELIIGISLGTIVLIVGGLFIFKHFKSKEVKK